MLQHFLSYVLKSHRLCISIVLLIAFVCVLPTLNMGYHTDDFIQRNYILGNADLAEKGLLFSNEPASLKDTLLHTFTFFDPDIDGQIQTQIEYGSVPWWCHDQIKISFFRPLASFTHWLDYKLWPDSLSMIHAHSVFWFMLLVGALMVFYQRIFNHSWVALLAGLFYCLDVSNIIPVGWIANRNVLIAVFFGLVTLILHQSWQKTGFTRYCLFSAITLLLSLFSAEAGIATCAFIFAYVVFMQEENYKKKLLSLIPSVVTVVFWRIIYQLFNYGASNTGMYTDPISNSFKFITSLVNRGPLLILSQFTGKDLDLYGELSLYSAHVLWLISLTFLVILAIILWPLLNRDRIARFWALATILTVIPVAAFGLPQGRLLIFVSIAAMGLMAQYIRYLFVNDGIIKKTGIVIIGFLHILIPLFVKAMLIVVILQLFISGQKLTFPLKKFTDFGNSEDIERQDLIIINAPSPFEFVYTPHVRNYYNLPNPQHIRILSAALTPIQVYRKSENTLVIKPQQGYLQPPGILTPGDPEKHPFMHQAYLFKLLTHGYRTPNFPFKLGEEVVLDGVRIKILSLTDDGRPANVEFHFDYPLRDDKYKIVMWDWNKNNDKKSHYIPFKLPEIGKTITITGPFY